MIISVSEKKEFLSWLVNNISFNQRETLWILNYLINHEAILTNVHFVEEVDKTDRGLKITATDVGDEPVKLFVEKREFYDTDQIFHDIRLNWKTPLYIECIFNGSWQNAHYLSILEDNPYARWNEQVSEETVKEIQDYFDQEEKQAQMDSLYQKIDLALEKNNHEAFLKLSKELKDLTIHKKK